MPKLTDRSKYADTRPGARRFRENAERYFDECRTNSELPTIPGLAYALGFSSRDVLAELRKSTTALGVEARKAYLYIERDYARNLADPDTKNARGIEFVMQNGFGYNAVRQVELVNTLEEFLDIVLGVIQKYVPVDDQETARAELVARVDGAREAGRTAGLLATGGK